LNGDFRRTNRDSRRARPAPGPRPLRTTAAAMRTKLKRPLTRAKTPSGPNRTVVTMAGSDARMWNSPGMKRRRPPRAVGATGVAEVGGGREERQQPRLDPPQAVVVAEGDPGRRRRRGQNRRHALSPGGAAGADLSASVQRRRKRGKTDHMVAAISVSVCGLRR